MLKFKSSKLLLVGTTLAVLAGCSSTENTDYSAIRNVSNSASMPQGQKLGGGFVAGMSPEQACIYFLDHYKTKKNDLCRQIGKKDFTNLTLVNRDITNTPAKMQGIDTIAFFFDNSKGLTKVMAVADDSHNSEGKREYRRKIENTVPMMFY